MFELDNEELRALQRVIVSRWLRRRSEVERFERKLAETAGARYALGVSSGTSALRCALSALGVGPGDEVIVPGFTYMATAMAPILLGALPVLTDVDDTLTIDASRLESRITARTRAILAVHMYGHPCNLRALAELAAAHHLPLVEDACQAVGARFQGKAVGTWGTMGAYSFGQYKTLTGGEAGALVTDSFELFARADAAHESHRFRPEEQGSGAPILYGPNQRMSELQGAILSCQLDKLAGIGDRLRRRRGQLIERLSALPACQLAPCHDPEGADGTTTLLKFESPEHAATFVRLLPPGLGQHPRRTAKHVYDSWAPLMTAGGVPGWRPADRRHHPDLLPTTLHHLDRCAAVFTQYQNTEDRWLDLVASIHDAAVRATGHGAPRAFVPRQPVRDSGALKAGFVGAGLDRQLGSCSASPLFRVIGVAEDEVAALLRAQPEVVFVGRHAAAPLVSERLLEAGVPLVLCGAALDADELARLRDVAAARGVPLAVDWDERWRDRDFRAVDELAKSGAIGELYWLIHQVGPRTEQDYPRGPLARVDEAMPARVIPAPALSAEAVPLVSRVLTLMSGPVDQVEVDARRMGGARADAAACFAVTLRVGGTMSARISSFPVCPIDQPEWQLYGGKGLISGGGERSPAPRAFTAEGEIAIDRRLDTSDAGLYQRYHGFLRGEVAPLIDLEVEIRSRRIVQAAQRRRVTRLGGETSVGSEDRP